MNPIRVEIKLYKNAGFHTTVLNRINNYYF